MTARYDYDAGFDPPAPVLPIRVGPPGREASVLLPALADTGADLTVVPQVIAHQAALPVVGEVGVRGVDGVTRRAALYAAQVEVEGAADVLEVVALGEQTLVGRDLLNRWVATFDGPGGSLEIARP